MKQLNKILKGYFKIYAVVCYVIIAAVIIMVVVDVTLRWLFNSPLADTIEMIRFFLPMITFLPLAFTLDAGQHISVTAVVDHLPATARKIVLALAYTIGAAVMVLISIGAWRYYLQSAAFKEMASGAVWWIPTYICKFCVFLGDVSMVIAYLMQILNLFVTSKTECPAATPGEQVIG